MPLILISGAFFIQCSLVPTETQNPLERGRDRIAGPTLDLLIDPRIGRAPETIGEDPFLGGRISEAFVLGQNTTSVFGSIKHYNLNTYELNRRTNTYLSLPE